MVSVEAENLDLLDAHMLVITFCNFGKSIAHDSDNHIQGSDCWEKWTQDEDHIAHNCLRAMSVCTESVVATNWHQVLVNNYIEKPIVCVGASHVRGTFNV